MTQQMWSWITILIKKNIKYFLWRLICKQIQSKHKRWDRLSKGQKLLKLELTKQVQVGQNLFLFKLSKTLSPFYLTPEIKLY